MSAQRFPGDFDGIVSGAPVYNQLHLSASQLQRQLDVIRHPAKRLTPEKVTLRAASLVKACDASDGGADGNREPPRSLLVLAGDARVLACSHEAAHR